MKNSKLLFLTQGALIAAMYTALTYLSNLFGLASGAIQVRISEALTVLPFFTPAAIPGLFVGCLISNILTGCALWDIVFGSLTTLAAAFMTWLLRKYMWLAPVPPIVFNMVVVPFILRYVYALDNALPYLILTVGAGELISCGILGMFLLIALKKYEGQIFGGLKHERKQK